MFFWEIIVTVSIKSRQAWMYFLLEAISFAGRDVIVKYAQLECQNFHTFFLVAKDVSFRPPFVCFEGNSMHQANLVAWATILQHEVGLHGSGSFLEYMMLAVLKVCFFVS